MYGEYEHTVDAKGRMNFPAKLLKEFGERFYISKSFNGKCLAVYTEDSWQTLKNKLKEKPSKTALPIERFIFGGACEAEPDKQGRIALPAPLRAFAGITTEVVVVGLVESAEIWDKQAWLEYNSRTTLDDISTMADELEI